jgi:hypothetical protein
MEDEESSSSEGEEGERAAGHTSLSRKPPSISKVAGDLQDARVRETAMREIHQAGEMANRKHYWQDKIKATLAAQAQRRQREGLQIAELPDEGKEEWGEPWGWEAEEVTIEEQLRRLGEAVDEWLCSRPKLGQQEVLRMDTAGSRNQEREMVNLILQAAQEMGRLLDGIRLRPLDPARWRGEELHRPRRVEEVRALTSKAKLAMEQAQVGGKDSPWMGERGR